jgi:acyl-coenzyme A synthetase/AMP-(fatty) acid ligase
MTCQTCNTFTLRNLLVESGSSSQVVASAEAQMALADLPRQSALYGRADELEGRSVLLATTSQFTTALALIELDGVARRIVLCPPEVQIEHLPYVADAADVDGIVTDRSITGLGNSRPLYFCPCSRTVMPANTNLDAHCETEWILLTSGTTGAPKLVLHTLTSLTAGIRDLDRKDEKTVWSTFYDIRRYGGLQVFLRAMLSGSSLVLSSPEESIPHFVERAAAHGVTHISGTPSHWRRALMSPSAHLLQPQYIRLSGEPVDQAILNRLRATWPGARIVHAFASTEAGVAFEVCDERAGFPEEFLASRFQGLELKVNEGTLRIRSARCARRYLGNNAPRLKDDEGFVNTADLIEVRNGRCHFAGRRDGVINVGGLKVYPEEVEAVIAHHPGVDTCLVRAKQSPITGAVVIAEVVLREDGTLRTQRSSVQEDILQLCRESLPAHKVPVAINLVPMLAIAGSGKVMRQNA